ncbi:MAG: radical SAM protein, partial [Eubacteriales bacterium]|nr:radical SAM protein [Eubacteriales bacterium]
MKFRMDLKQKQTLNKKILITAINSSYVHMSPVPWYLNAVCPESAVTEIAEYTINDCTYKVAADIFRREPDIVTFSCYIWNIAMTEKLTSILKKTIPALTVIWGGPEVSYDCSSQMEKNSGVDYLIAGEGEEAFRRLVSRLTWDILYDTMPDGTKEAASATNEEEAAMSGIAYRKGSSIKYDGKLNKVEDLDTIPSPYSEKMLATAKGRIVYLESSRGCPFRCSYCISSVDPGVRYFNVDRIIGEIDRLKNCGARQLKFVDRTFNINKERAEKILEAVLNSGYESSFHFEIAGDLPDDKFISLMGRAPNGLIQIEAGVQTLNIKSLELVGRQTDNEKLFRNISKIISKRNIHVHLDLIAALPGDTCESFAESFNEVYKLAPDDLQLGFLKMLKGTRIRKEAGLYKYKYDDEPPYEVFSSASFSYTEIITLKDIEEVLSRYYNSRRFAFSVEYARKKLFMQPFVFYNKLAAY